MKNKKGFSLVELLAVIAIIAIVATIGIFSSIAIKNKMNKKMFESELKEILASAEKYGSDNKEDLEDSEGETILLSGTQRKFKEVTVEELLNTKYYSSDETDEEGNKAVIYYETNLPINDLKILVYETNNSGRISSCIPYSDLNERYLDNESYFDASEFKELGIYCTNYSPVGGFSSIRAEITDDDKWTREKTVNITVVNKDVHVTGYKFVKDKNECKQNTTGWLSLTENKNFWGTIENYTASKKITEQHGAVYENYYICVQDETNGINKKTIRINKIDSIAPSCEITGENSTWKNTPVLINIACNDGTTGKESGCTTATASFSKTYNTSKEKDSFTLVDLAGNSTTCNYNVYVDTDKPTCSLSYASNKINLTKNETGGSGIKIFGLSKSTGANSNGVTSMDVSNGKFYGYVQDNAGNSVTCSGQATYSTCATGSNTCKGGYVDKNCSDCHTGKNTCKYGCDSVYDSCASGSNTCKYGCDSVYSSCATGSNTCKYGCDSVYSSCATGSNTCKYGCDNVYSSCATGSNTCKGGYIYTYCNKSLNVATCKVVEGMTYVSGKGCCEKVYSSCATGSNTCKAGYVQKNCSNCYTGSNTCKAGYVQKNCSNCYTGSNTCKAGYVQKNCSNCYTGSNTCKAGYVQKNCSNCYTGSNTCKAGYVQKNCSNCYTGSNTCKAGYVQKNCSSCYTGSNTCKYGCDSVYDSCASGSNTCSAGYTFSN